MLGPAKLFEVGLFQIFSVYHGRVSLDVSEWGVFLRETIIQTIFFFGFEIHTPNANYSYNLFLPWYIDRTYSRCALRP